MHCRIYGATLTPGTLWRSIASATKPDFFTSWRIP